MVVGTIGIHHSDTNSNREENLVISICEEGGTIFWWTIRCTEEVKHLLSSKIELDSFSIHWTIKTSIFCQQNKNKKEWKFLSNYSDISNRHWTFDDTEEAYKPGYHNTAV